MIEILPADPEELAQLDRGDIGREGLLRGVVLWERKERQGYCLYTVCGKKVELLLASAPDLTLKDSLIRAALNTAYLEGAELGLCRTPTLEEAVRCLGFKDTPDGWCVPLREFFNRKCRQP
ncbi:MAG: hypothetical protein HFJ80_03885 [Clostridiales bacterium]|nr:hypothetical protein [Clostridiales bacterium]